VTGIKSAVERAGGAAKLAAALGVSHQIVYKWVARGWAPTARAAQIEELYGIPRAELADPQLAAFFGANSTPVTN